MIRQPHYPSLPKKTRLWFVCFLNTVLGATTAFAATATASFTTNATIASGCVLGASGNVNVSTFGTLNFGNIVTLPLPVHVASSANAGSIVLKCTPGIHFSIALDNGLNAPSGINAGRKMLVSGGGATLTYQLYQDSSYSTIWGNGTNGGIAMNNIPATGALQTFTVYGSVLANATLPTVGIYSDTVTVTVTY